MQTQLQISLVYVRITHSYPLSFPYTSKEAIQLVLLSSPSIYCIPATTISNRIGLRIQLAPEINIPFPPPSRMIISHTALTATPVLYIEYISCTTSSSCTKMHTVLYIKVHIQYVILPNTCSMKINHSQLMYGMLLLSLISVEILHGHAIILDGWLTFFQIHRRSFLLLVHY